MLQALIQGKLGQAIKDGYFSPQEDTLTSSTIGLLQYLPSTVLWEILYDAIADKRELPHDLGEIQHVSFWRKLTAGDKSSNVNYVEPDVLIETEQYHIIIEAKRFDEGGQYRQQWYNEIEALRAEESECTKPVLLIALGGNRELETLSIGVNREHISVYRLKWLQLLHAINQYQDKSEDISSAHTRILRDVIEGFAVHGYFDIKWLNGISNRVITTNRIARPYFEFGQLSSLFQRNISKEYIHLLWKK